MQEYRCKCGKLLFKGVLLISTVEVKCRGCGMVRRISDISADLIGEDTFALLFDSAGFIANANHAAAKILGYSEADLAGMHISALDISTGLNFYRRLLATFGQKKSESFSIRAFYRDAAGSVLKASVQFKFLDIHGQGYTFAVVDTKRPYLFQGEKGKTLGESWFGNAGNEIFFQTDIRGVCLRANQNVADAFGYAPGAIVGRNLADFCPDLAGFFVRSAKEMLAPILIADNGFLHKDSRRIPMESHFNIDFSGNEQSGFRIYSWLSPLSLAQAGSGT